MERFIDKHTAKITGTIACFDRILFKGYLPISWAEAMERFMHNQGLLLKEFKGFVMRHSERLKEHARSIAEKSGRPYIHLNGQVRKEEKAREIGDSDGITQGPICILTAVEACQSFRLVPGEKRPRLVSAHRTIACACCTKVAENDTETHESWRLDASKDISPKTGEFQYLLSKNSMVCGITV